jgi:acyl carrier protein
MESMTEQITRLEIKELIVELLVEEFDIDAELLTDAATLKDLDLDSLDMVEIGQVVEQKYGVRVRVRDAEGVTDFAGVIEMIVNKIAASRNEANASQDQAART